MKPNKDLEDLNLSRLDDQNTSQPLISKGILDTNFLDKHKLVHRRQAKNPLGNFWKYNLNKIFKDFWWTISGQNSL